MSPFHGSNSALSLAYDEVHVWLARLKLSDGHVAGLHVSLASDERERAARFHFERDRRRYIVAHGFLRDILARYLGQPAASLTFEYSPYNKPSLPTETAQGLRFNLSHANEVALLAVARNRELGVDIEQLRPDLPLEIAEHYFSASELAALRSVPEPLQAAAFLICWTRKESYIKAHGEGLSLPLASFDVSLIPGEPARLLAVRGEAGEVERWTLRALPAPSAYLAAITVEGQGWDLCYRQWPEGAGAFKL